MDKIEAVAEILTDNLKILGKHNENGLEVSYFGIDVVDVDTLARQIVERLTSSKDLLSE